MVQVQVRDQEWELTVAALGAGLGISHPGQLLAHEGRLCGLSSQRHGPY